jgi:O-methyltransferase
VSSAWRRNVNASLSQLTGYRLVKARKSDAATSRNAAASKPVKPQTALPKKHPSSAKKPIVLVNEPAAPAPKKASSTAPSAATGTPPFPRDFDETSRKIITAVGPWTMTSRDKLFGLITAVRYVTQHGISGDIVECGVWRGGSMQAAARTLLSLDDTSRDLYLFDTYEGMPPPGDEDERPDGTSASELLKSAAKTSKLWAVASLDDVQQGFSEVGYPPERVHFIKGMVEDTVPDAAPEHISILRLDTDWYNSTRHELEHLYPRLASGGVLIIDDYGYWRGSAKAVDEFIEGTGERLLLLRASTGRIAVKP